MAVTAQQETELLAMCTQFFAESLQFNLTLYSLSKWALIAAMVLLVLQGIISLLKLLKAAPEGGEVSVAGAGRTAGLKELLEVFPKFIDSLAKAPAAIALVVVALLLIWVPTVDAPEICTAPLTETVGDADLGDEPGDDTGESAES
ncbi:hypothetical protein [Pontixanthobacter aquaemixtae]|uniref:Uncharacterized protein n=1 Tax=Pontixanthobacter aquaemixtae TaxID=1958940 RepID=A0A844ZRV5_9SPHN|nr:hypothetical protein [Pontixanthobacter aquaemixtae]MXO90593.1 hypothetical protein [Pontixanthobacter aquaemixtae]